MTLLGIPVPVATDDILGTCAQIGFTIEDGGSAEPAEWALIVPEACGRDTPFRGMSRPQVALQTLTGTAS
jgi:hypothetical protein